MKNEPEFFVRQIDDLKTVDLTALVNESRAEGFRFLERLQDDYFRGLNRFEEPGEGLYGIFSRDGELHGIGGLNRDPFSRDHKTGRIRRFYIRKVLRDKGLGSLLLNSIISDGGKQFTAFVLYTDTKEAAAFYERRGFHREDRQKKISHRYELQPGEGGMGR
ncbi:GNAT family N-acetyltransferase [Alteribacter natronophilus]|uniref:GNAT family N-acetyltransferase n=1 Tax=Alteribacter natronophilus TaxID=2583810 RepID=UPI0014867B9A|nr:GNAT family N-acetyltransferase [Alteribacter natronophilus]